MYSCEYQLTAIDYYTGTGAAQGQVPFFPAPPATNDNGACCKTLISCYITLIYAYLRLLACSLGYVYTNMTSTVAGNTCSNVTLSTGGDLPSVDNCLCCQFSIPLSKFVPVTHSKFLSTSNYFVIQNTQYLPQVRSFRPGNFCRYNQRTIHSHKLNQRPLHSRRDFQLRNLEQRL